jgi:hypothetical protein
VPALAGTPRVTELARGAAVTTANARFFAMPLPVVLHILAVIPYSLPGALQFRRACGAAAAAGTAPPAGYLESADWWRPCPASGWRTSIRGRRGTANFCTQVFTHLPWFILVGGAPPELPRAVMMGGAWLLNALVAESIIRKGRRTRVAPSNAPPLSNRWRTT